jgi:hypothetical protein
MLYLIKIQHRDRYNLAAIAIDFGRELAESTVTNPMKNKGLWWAFRDSNTGPIDYEEQGEGRSVSVSGRIVTGFSGGKGQGNRDRTYAEPSMSRFPIFCQ